MALKRRGEEDGGEGDAEGYREERAAGAEEERRGHCGRDGRKGGKGFYGGMGRGSDDECLNKVF